MKHGFERIIAHHENPEDKADILKDADEFLEQKAKRRDYPDTKPYEVEKDEWEKEVIVYANIIVDKILRDFGVEPKEVDLTNIHILEPGGVLAASGGVREHGFTQINTGRIVVERGLHDLEFILTTAHEILHQKSPKIARVVNSNRSDVAKKLETHKSGITMYDMEGKNIWFSTLEEAIVTELTDRIFSTILKEDPQFKDDAVATEKLKDRIRMLGAYIYKGKESKRLNETLSALLFVPHASVHLEEAAVRGKNAPTGHSAQVEWEYINAVMDEYSANGALVHKYRKKERAQLKDICKRIHKACSSVYPSEKAVFDTLVVANFTGKTMDLARNIEAGMGKGSFRKLGEETV